MQVDMWAIGCIFAEIVTKQPLFPGTSEMDQLQKIFATLGTPNDQIWPGVTKLKEYSMSFPNWQPVPMNDIVP